jgi:hypothetical protein
VAQLEVLTSPVVRGYLQEHAGDNWKIVDDDFSSDQIQYWTDAWKIAYDQAKRKSGGTRPYILITNGPAGVAAPLPANVEETMAMLRKYAE